jgi:hypothetical protein
MNAEIALMCGIGFLVSLDLAATLAIAHKLFGKNEEQRGEEAAQAAIDAAAEEDRDEERERRGSFDEGFENLMRFSVNGKTGFEDIGR